MDTTTLALIDTPADPLHRAAAALADAANGSPKQGGNAAGDVCRTAATTGQVVSRLVYSCCYFLSYGVVFPTLCLAELFPFCGPITAGLTDGANAAAATVKDRRSKNAEAELLASFQESLEWP
jgi:hypothetical protein